MKGSTRWLVVGFKLVMVPAALLLVLAQTVDFSPELGSSGINIKLLLIGLVANQLANWTMAERLRASLAAVGFALPRWAALRIHLQSIFYFFVLPTMGIELSRLGKLATLDPTFSKMKTAVGLLVDRGAGVFAAVAVVGACLFIVDSEALGIPAPGFAGVIAASALFVGVVVIVWMLREQIRGSLRSVVWPATPAIVFWGVPTQVLFCAACWLVASAFLADLDVVEFFLIVSASNLLMAIPVSFAGAGLAEAGATGLWLLAGYSLEVAVVLAFVPYALRLLVAVQGAVWEVMSGAAGLMELNRKP